MSAPIRTSRSLRRSTFAAAVCVALATATITSCGSSSDDAQSDPARSAAASAPDGTPTATTTPDPTTTPSAPTPAAAATTSPTFPPGTYVRTVDDDLLASLETAGLDPDFITWLRDTGPTSFEHEFTTDGRWNEGEDVCRCGVSKRADLGTYTFDDDNHLVVTSESTGCPGCVTVLDWRYEDDVLAFTGISFPDGTHIDTTGTLPDPLPDEFDPIGYILTSGTWHREPVAPETFVLNVGMTPGWDAIVDPILAAVDDASSGSLQGRFDLAWMDAHFAPDIEQQLIDAVAAGELDMAFVATRAFGDRGANDFDALSAPFLIGDYTVQQAILDSDIPGRMLAAVDIPGVTALALAPGPFRYLQGVDRTFASPTDFVGTTFHTFPSPIYAATAEALGATHTDAFGPARDSGLENGTIDVTENTLGWMRSNGRTGHVTVGAALWPATGVLIINTDVLAALTGEQVAVLRQVVADAVPTASDYATVDADDLAQLCKMGMTVHVATETELEDLRAAAQPVYAELDRDDVTAAYITEIQAIAASAADRDNTLPTTCGD